MVPTLNLIFVHIVLVCFYVFSYIFYSSKQDCQTLRTFVISYLGHFNRTHPPARRVSSRPSDRYDFVRPHTHTPHAPGPSRQIQLLCLYILEVCLQHLRKLKTCLRKLKHFTCENVHISNIAHWNFELA